MGRAVRHPTAFRPPKEQWDLHKGRFYLLAAILVGFVGLLWVLERAWS